MLKCQAVNSRSNRTFTPILPHIYPSSRLKQQARFPNPSSRPTTRDHQLRSKTRESYGSAKHLHESTHFHAQTAHDLNLKVRPAQALLLSSNPAHLKISKGESNTRNFNYLKRSSTQTSSATIEHSSFLRLLYSSCYRPPNLYEVKALEHMLPAVALYPKPVGQTPAIGRRSRRRRRSPPSPSLAGICSDQLFEEFPSVLISSGLLVQADKGTLLPVVDLIRRNLPQSTVKSQSPCDSGWSQAPRRQQGNTPKIIL
ncbi:hypothetical protein F511_32042 [Dorcoceras hygrometricum]|uniref:Uncharacterized protein n=1 Tax=Dorcoceras hygrometricum TaxID=472368 RepID=A0A2Z7AG75_9LAMI|nr:hypothetical protein F511_32042 [Dorcoceras hygrometricum]